MPKSKIVYSFNKCTRYQQFREQLRQRGVRISTLWQARKDGKAWDGMRDRYPDVECIVFAGRGVDVTLSMAIVTLHTGVMAPDKAEDIGFNIFFASPNNEYAKDIETILGKTE